MVTTPTPLVSPLYNQRPIENPIVMFDMDGTLLDLSFDNYFWLELVPQHYAQQRALPLSKAMVQLNAQIMVHRKTLNWYSLDFWSEQLKLDLHMLKRENQHRIRLRPDALKVLQALKTANIETWLVTNADPFSLMLKLEYTQISSFFDQIISSHTLLHPKESIEFWQSLQQRYIFDKNRTILVDDNNDVLDCAKQFGITVLFSIAYPDTISMQRHSSSHPMLDSLLEVLPSVF